MTRKIEHLKGNTSARIHHQSEVGGATDIAEVKRALNGITKFPDGTTIPAYPTLAATITDAERKKVRDWLELFLSRIQYD